MALPSEIRWNFNFNQIQEFSLNLKSIRGDHLPPFPTAIHFPSIHPYISLIMPFSLDLNGKGALFGGRGQISKTMADDG